MPYTFSFTIKGHLRQLSEHQQFIIGEFSQNSPELKIPTRKHIFWNSRLLQSLWFANFFSPDSLLSKPVNYLYFPPCKIFHPEIDPTFNDSSRWKELFLGPKISYNNDVEQKFVNWRPFLNDLQKKQKIIRIFSFKNNQSHELAKIDLDQQSSIRQQATEFVRILRILLHSVQARDFLKSPWLAEMTPQNSILREVTIVCKYQINEEGPAIFSYTADKGIFIIDGLIKELQYLTEQLYESFEVKQLSDLLRLGAPIIGGSPIGQRQILNHVAQLCVLNLVKVINFLVRDVNSFEGVKQEFGLFLSQLCENPDIQSKPGMHSFFTEIGHRLQDYNQVTFFQELVRVFNSALYPVKEEGCITEFVDVFRSNQPGYANLLKLIFIAVKKLPMTWSTLGLSCEALPQLEPIDLARFYCFLPR